MSTSPEQERVAALIAAIHEAGHAVAARVLAGPGVVHSIDVRRSDALEGSSHVQFEPPSPTSPADQADSLARIGAFFASGRAAVELALERSLGIDLEQAHSDPWLAGVIDAGTSLDHERSTECAEALRSLASSPIQVVAEVQRIVERADEGTPAMVLAMRAWADVIVGRHLDTVLEVAAALVRTPRMSASQFEASFSRRATGRATPTR